MTPLLVLHLVVGTALIAGGDRLGRRSFLVAAAPPLATLGWAATKADAILGGDAVVEHQPWVAGLDLALELRLDAFGLVMVALVAGIGLLVCAYSLSYFSHPQRAIGRLAGLMTLFAGSMLGVVTADHLLALFVFWELTSVTSYALIGNDDRDPAARGAALQAILITGAGGLAMLAGFVLVGHAGGTYRLSELLVDPPSGPTVTAGVLCILAGALTKSAQVPFASWLPGAMVAPTPISAYLHSATMVKAGVYLIARMAPLFATLGAWRPLVLGVGGVTMVLAGLRAMRQHDLKLLLAHGTVSQLGFMTVLVGSGTYSAGQAGVALLLSHGLFKAALFMVVGIVDHQAGTRDVRRLGRLGPGWSAIHVVTVLSAASMAGVPPLIGFIAKEKGFDALDHAGFAGDGWALAAIVAGSVLTVAYSGRFVLGVFGRLAAEGDTATVHGAAAPARSFVAPALVLTVLSVVTGVLPITVTRLVEAATTSLYPASDPSPVELWSGLNTALVLSAVVLSIGTVLVLSAGRVEAIQSRASAPLHSLPSSERTYLWALRAVSAGATRITAVVQNGSLPIYLGVIVAVAAVGTLVPAATELNGSWPDMLDAPMHVPLSAVIVAAAVGATVAKRRIAAALMLGAVGYAMAGLYVVQGAPDLALTQFAIETLATVLFVLVLRFLPRRFDEGATIIGRTASLGRAARLAISGLVTATVFVVAIVASGARDDVGREPISDAMVARAPDAKGNNVVNVILVDFRGLDTLGEITVLVVAALGAVALTRSTRRGAAQAAAPAETGDRR